MTSTWSTWSDGTGLTTTKDRDGRVLGITRGGLDAGKNKYGETSPGLHQLTARLRDSWSKATSADPDRWTHRLPSVGQCAVTALVVQDRYGGDLLRVVVDTGHDSVSHYFNRLPGGGMVDLTYGQFERAEVDLDKAELRTREYVLSFPETVRRYGELCLRLATS